MAKLPRPTGKQMLDFLNRQGFSIIRIRGSHHVVKMREWVVKNNPADVEAQAALAGIYAERSHIEVKDGKTR